MDNYFNWTDAWVFTALYYSTKDGSELNLRNLISAGDYLNHAIFERNEVVEGLTKVQKRGLLLLKNQTISYSEIAEAIFEKFNKSKGGQFSRVDIMLKNLNSNRNKFPLIDEVNFCEFITDLLLKSAYESYSNSIILNK
ncbi:hypothetical protein [Leptospira kmetyi]|uniref:hypothetical protein n=1 Tax=Leptospira kmetyi TaxID=408139 RepID=UPI000287DB52|nr:hypothetical protein [Leptospira kmetyi]